MSSSDSIARNSRTSPRSSHFSGGYTGHGEIQSDEEQSPWWENALAAVPAAIVIGLLVIEVVL